MTFHGVGMDFFWNYTLLTPHKWDTSPLQGNLQAYWGAGMAQWWERLPPTNVARVRFPHLASYVGWVCVGSRPCSEGFSPGTPVFLPQQKPRRSLFELAVGCAPRSCMDRTAAASSAYICFRSDHVELRPCCTLRGRLARQLLLLLL